MFIMLPKKQLSSTLKASEHFLCSSLFFFFYIAFCSEETSDPVSVTDLFPNIPVAHEAEVFLEIYLCTVFLV